MILPSSKLGSFISFAKGKKPGAVTDYPMEGCKRFIQIDDLRNDSNLKYTTEHGVEVTANDVLLAWDGANAGTIGFGLSGYIGSTLARLRINSEKIDPIYLGWFLRGKSATIRAQCYGATIPHVNKAILQSIEVPLPALSIQKQIAAILDKADGAREKRRQANQLTEQFLQSAFLEMFGDPVTNPKEWEVISLGSLLTFLTSGSRGWAKYYSAGGDKFLRIQNVGRNRLHLDDIAYVDAPDGAEARRTMVKEGDVLLSITADLGRTCVIPRGFGTAYINQHLSILRTKGIHPMYLSAYLASEGGASQIRRLDRQGVKSGLNFEDIKSLKVLRPAKVLQEKYVALVGKVESLLAKQKESEKELENLFNSLMQKAFKGELV